MLTFFPSLTVGAIRRKLSGAEAGCIGITVRIDSRIIEDDAAALSADAPRGGFEQAHDAQAELAIAERGLVLADATCEVSHDLLERLARFHTRAEDVAAAI